VISGTSTGTVVEAGGGTPGTPTATGTLTDTDVDNPANTFTAVAAGTASYGTYQMTAAGVWTYTLDNSNSAVQALNVGDHLTDTFTVTTVDGTAQQVTITINGSDPASDNFIFARTVGHDTVADHNSDVTEIDHTVPADIQHLLDTAHDTNAVGALGPNHATASQDMTNVQPHHQGDFHFA
jgi:VCBS repeat-containing protein